MTKTPSDLGDHQTIRQLSDRLVEIQRPIRILDAIKWDAKVRAEFFSKKCSALPQVDAAYYRARSLGFEPQDILDQLLDLDIQVVQNLGEYNVVGTILRRMCREYTDAVRMIEARGTPQFSKLSKHLYGSAHDAFYEGEPTLAEFGEMMGATLQVLTASGALPEDEPTIPAAEAVAILQHRLAESFPGKEKILVRSDPDLEADAAAGAEHISLRSDAFFSERELRLLEVHEGWVHVATTLNGLAQPYCTFLSKGPPSSTVTQEGLAVLMEVLAFASYPKRVARISNRIRAVAMAESGADFLDVFRFYREQGLGDDECYTSTQRVFRGSTPDGSPFTKDVSYSKGFILIYNYIQLAVREGKLDRIPLLFCGKTTLGDLPSLKHMMEQGIVVAPVHLPPQFADMSALAAWMCFAQFLRGLNLERIEKQHLPC